MVHGEIRCAACHMPVDVCCEGAPLREHEVPVCPIPATELPAQPETVGGSGEAVPARPASGRPGETEAEPGEAAGRRRRARRRS